TCGPSCRRTRCPRSSPSWPRTRCPCCPRASSTAERSASGCTMQPDGLTLPDLIDHRARNEGDVAFMVDDGDTLTFGELEGRARALAARLVAAGVVPGSRIGLLMPNGIEWAVTAVAVMRIGAVLVPLSTLLRVRELEAQLRVANVVALIATPG